MENSRKYIRNGKTISGRLHDEMVMMDLEQGKYFSLNPVATRIWELLEAPVTVDELCGHLTVEYEISKAECLAELTEHLNEMIRLGLVLRV